VRPKDSKQFLIWSRKDAKTAKDGEETVLYRSRGVIASLCALAPWRELWNEEKRAVLTARVVPGEGGQEYLYRGHSDRTRERKPRAKQLPAMTES